MKFSSKPNYIKASNLLFIGAVLGFINFLLSQEILSSKSTVIISLTTISLILLFATLVRFEIIWVRYILLVLIIFGINSFPPIIKYELTNHPVNGIIIILQSILQIYATILLSLNIKPKK